MIPLTRGGRDDADHSRSDALLPGAVQAQADAERRAQVLLRARVPGGRRPFRAQERGARRAGGALGRQGQGDAAEEAAEVAVPGRCREAMPPATAAAPPSSTSASKQQPGIVDRYAGRRWQAAADHRPGGALPGLLRAREPAAVHLRHQRLQGRLVRAAEPAEAARRRADRRAPAARGRVRGDRGRREPTSTTCSAEAGCGSWARRAA